MKVQKASARFRRFFESGKSRSRSLTFESLEGRTMLSAVLMDQGILKDRAFALSQEVFEPVTVPSVPILDYPADSRLESVGLVFQEKDAITTGTFLDQNGVYVKPQVRASNNVESMQVFVDDNRDGWFDEKTYADAGANYSAPIIQPPINPNDIPPEGKVISQLTVGARQPENGYPQFLTIGAEGYGRFNGYFPQTVGSSYRVAAQNPFALDGTEEDFPFFREMYATIDGPNSATLLGLVDSAAFTGAVSMTITPGPNTVIEVDATWFPRRDLLVAEDSATAFLAYSSLFWKDEHDTPLDSTDEAHDMDTLVVGLDTNGDTIPDKVVTAGMVLPGIPGTVTVTDFDALYGGRPVFVSLDNRDSDPAHYQAFATANYATRDSYAFEIIHSDVDLGLRLYEQFTASEYHDNIVVAALVREDLHPAATANDGIRVVSRHHAFYPADSNGDGLTDLLDSLLGGQPVQQIAHLRAAASLRVPTQYPTIGAAIEAAHPGDTIEVAPGVYTENLDIAKNDLRILGAGQGITMLRGQEGSIAPVVQFRGVDRSVLFSGFTVEGGYAATDRQGGGIDIDNASPVIQHNEITGNSSRAVGGGMTIRGGLSDPLIQGNHIHHNHTRQNDGFAGYGGGIYLGDGARGEIFDNQIDNNSAWSSGAGIYSGPLTAGLYTLMAGGGSSVIRGNTITANSSDSDGGVTIANLLSGSQVTLANNIITHNLGDYMSGAGIAVYGSNVRIINNTIFRNRGTGQAGYGISISGSEPAEIRNNIVAENEYGICAPATAMLEYNDVYGHTLDAYCPPTTPGLGSISADPLFVDAENGDDNLRNYHLRNGSAAIDAGDPATEYADTDGTPNDMGAYGGPFGTADTTAPTVTSKVPTANSTITTPSVNIDVTFSETVGGVDATDLVLTGTAVGQAVKSTPTNTSGNTWRFPVSGLVNGTWNVSLAPDANDIEDLAGNDLANLNWSYTNTLSPTSEDFETGDFSKFPWTHPDTIDWTVTTATPHGGTYAAQSGAIGNSATTTLQVTQTTAAGNITFWRKVSSEASCDYLRFTIDGVQQGTGWSGSLAWTQQSYAVTAGPHVFEWVYSKDGSVSVGSDAAWIDDIVFPGDSFPTPSIVPTGIDLLDASDTGVSTTDDLTNLDNSTAGKALQFSVSGTVSGATVTVYADGTEIGSTVASGTTTTVTTNGTTDLTDGSHSLTARQTESSQTESGNSPALSVTVDTVASSAPDVPDIETASDSGVSNTDNITNDSTPTFSVSAEPYFRIYWNGTSLYYPLPYLTGTAFTFPEREDGIGAVQISEVDAAGNESALSAALTVSIDLCQPSTMGVLDKTFDGDGLAYASFGSNTARTQDVAIQTDGKIVTVGSVSDGTDNDFAVLRYLADGTLDASFDGDGIAITPFSSYGNDDASGVAMQWDDGMEKVVVVGYSSNATGMFAMARYLPNGSLDPAFGVSGKKEFSAIDIENGQTDFDVQLQTDGRIVVAGGFSTGSYSDFLLARFDADGQALDTTFGGDGIVITPVSLGWDRAEELVIQPDGMILAAGTANKGYSSDQDFAVVRYRSDGTLDSSFGTGGIATVSFTLSDQGRAIALQSDGKIVVGGSVYNSTTSSDFALARLSADGTLDSGFGTGGKLTTDFGLSDTHWYGSYSEQAYDLAIQPDGKIVAAGLAQSYRAFGIARYNPEGTLDTTFGSRGTAYANMGPFQSDWWGAYVFFGGMALQEDGRIVVTGSRRPGGGNDEDFVTARFLSSPVLSLALDPASDTGVSPTDNITSDNTPTFQLASTDTYVRVYRDGAQVSVDYQSPPTYTSVALADGIYAFSFSAVDAAGNESARSTALNVTLDITSPTAPVVSSPASAITVNASMHMIVGTAEVGSLVKVYVDANNNNQIDGGETVTAQQQLSGETTGYSIGVSLTQNAANHFLVTATDVASNVSAAADVPTITEDSGNTGLPIITVGDHVLLAGSANQRISIPVTGGQAVDGANVYLQVADGGPEAGGAVDGPVITAVDLFGATGYPATIFTGNNSTEAGDGSIYPQFWQSGTTTRSGTVAANGLLVTAVLDATGFAVADPHNPFALKMTGTLMGDSDFASMGANITDGRLILKNKPTAAIATPVTVPEGGTVTLSAVSSHAWDPNDTIVAYEWDLDGDGVFGESGTTALGGDEVGVAPVFSAAGLDGPSTLQIRLRVKDSNYAENPLFVSEIVTATLTVENVAPTVAAGADTTINEGETFAQAGSFTDSGDDTWMATVNYGDGSGVQPLTLKADKTYDLSHVYADNGTYTVTVAVTDDDTSLGSDTVTVTVNNVAPNLIDSLPAMQLNRGEPLVLSGVTFTDPGLTAEAYTATINWGDGSGDSLGTVIEPASGTPGTVTGSHTYAANGDYTVTVTLQDDDLGQDTLRFAVQVKSGEVVDRMVFYNNSYFDGNNPAPNVNDFNAIAPHTTKTGGHGPHPTGKEETTKELGKDALLPGQTATFVNYTNFSKGLNGIMVDIAGLAGTPTLADFQFKVGNTNDPTTWAIAPAPTSITVFVGQGTPDTQGVASDRITLIWADKVIQKTWLQVTVLTTANTGLAQPDVFYFGNAVGESGAGNTSTYAFVTVTDELAARNYPHNITGRAAVSDPYDYSKDSFVTVTDELLARNNATNITNALRLIVAPALPSGGAGQTTFALLGGPLDAAAPLTQPTVRTGRDVTPAFDASPLTPTLSPEYRGEGVMAASVPPLTPTLSAEYRGEGAMAAPVVIPVGACDQLFTQLARGVRGTARSQAMHWARWEESVSLLSAENESLVSDAELQLLDDLFAKY